MHNIYISGISKDNAHISKVKELIEQHFNNTKCWLDIADTNDFASRSYNHKAGMPNPDAYEIAIYVASQESQTSEWVFRELTYFMKMQTPLYAVLVDDLDFQSISRKEWFKGHSSLNDVPPLLSFIRHNLRVEEEFDIFISYSRRDFEKVYQFKKNLELILQGLRCWFDLDGIESGDQFERKIVSAIEKSKILLFAVSENSMTSEYAQREVTFAHNMRKRIVPVIIDSSRLSGWFLFRFGNINYTDVNDKKQFVQLITNLGHWFNITPKLHLINEIANNSTESFDAPQNDDGGRFCLEESESDCSLIGLGKAMKDVDYDADGDYDDYDITCPDHDNECIRPYNSEQQIKFSLSDDEDAVNTWLNIDEDSLCQSEQQTSIPPCSPSPASHCEPPTDELDSPPVQNAVSGNLVIQEKGFLNKCIGGLKRIMGSKQTTSVYTCVYAPSQAKAGSDLIIQVFLHLPTEIEKVKRHAKAVDTLSKQRNSKQLSIILKNGEVIDVELSIPAISVKHVSKSMMWNGHYQSVEFVVSVPEECKSDTLLSTVTLLKQSLPIAEMSFKIDVVSNPSRTYADIFGHIFRRAFISYSHKDIEIVEPIANQLKDNGIEYFFDKHTLKSGDRFRDRIKEWLELSDLFILCWSKNSEESKEVELERHMALEIANREGTSLRICPFIISPKAPIPVDMVDIYNFTEI